MKKIAVATFVKTIGHTPVKTRLARSLGQKAAEEFYALSVDLTEHVLTVASEKSKASGEFQLVPFWAVAEGEALDFWDSFDAVAQGNGELGDRLNHVYGTLQESHDGVLLVGSDCVTLGPEHLLGAGKALVSRGMDYVIGPAMDGGFYLFGGNKPIAEGIWKEVTYSSANTADQLLRALAGTGTCHKLEPLSDIDVLTDLQKLKQGLSSGDIQLPSGSETLTAWIENQAEL